MGLVGGRLGYWLLRRLGAHVVDHHGPSPAYHSLSKLEVVFGPGIWNQVRGKTVIDIGCGLGLQAIEVAQHGARRVIGIDIRQEMLDRAEENAARAGVRDLCLFTTKTIEPADLILSVDGFEHYDDPAGMLRLMRDLLRPDGRVMVSFGPPWLRPLGGHLFSVFPWSHLVFTERVLIRWRSDFKSDGATCFRETAGALNQMTLRRFERLLAQSDFEVQDFTAVPIRRLRHLSNRLTREFVTSVVRCTLIPKAS
jgi:SAM-dependent methyltransferase